MAFQLKLLVFWVFLLLSLSLCHGKNVTVKLMGLIHCTDCIRHEFSRSQASLGINVVIRCKSNKTVSKAQGAGTVDIQGKFNVTLSTEITNDGHAINCFAKLQSQSTSPCPIQTPQTASVKILDTDNNAMRKAHNRPVLLKFSPLTCQSAFLLPHPNFTFFPTLPPMGYAPPPLSPPEYSIPPPAQTPEPLYLPPIPQPTFQSPQNPPLKSPSPLPIPIYNTPPHYPPSKNEPIPPNFPIPPPSSTQLPKPPQKAFHQTPYLQSPSLPPLPPPYNQDPHFNPPIPKSATPTPFAQTPSPAPSPSPKSYPPSPIGMSIPTPRNQRKSNPIPRAPPVPQLPPIPPVPRKYFNPPNSNSQPPHPSYSSHF